MRPILLLPRLLNHYTPLLFLQLRTSHQSQWNHLKASLLIPKPIDQVCIVTNSLSLADPFYRAVTLIVLMARLIFRITQLTILFTPLLISFPAWYYINVSPNNGDDAVNDTWWLDYLVWTIELAGPIFVKLGQWASCRGDLFPSYVIDRLSKLQSNVKPHSFRYTESLFDGRIDEIFFSFDRNPVGVGSVAQVYKANLLDREGIPYPVAVKVLHPDAQLLIEIDLKVMYCVARVIEFIVPDSTWLSLPEEVFIFGSMMKQQVNLYNEGKNLDLFIKNFNGWPNVSFPKPLMGLTSEKVLVETWIDGVSMNHFMKFKSSCFDKRIAKIGLTSFLKMLILDNHLHSDLHAGNILISFKNQEDEKFISFVEVEKLKGINNPEEWTTQMLDLEARGFAPFVYFIDAGLTSSLSPLHLRNFLDLFKAIINFDGDTVSFLMATRSRYPASVIDLETFSQSMQAFMLDIRRQALKLKNIEVSQILSFVFSTVRRHHVKIDPEFANVAVGIVLLEGIGHILDSDIDLLRASGPFVQQAFANRIQGKRSENEKGFVAYWKNYWKQKLKIQ